MDVLLVLLVFSFTMAIASLITFNFYDQFYNETYDTFNDTTSQQALDTMKYQETMFDYIFLAMVIGLTIVGYVFAFMTKESPIFIWLNIIVVMVMVIAAVALSNAYEEVRENSVLNATAQEFPIQTYVFDNLPLLVTIAIAGMFLVMFTFGGSRVE